jgi:hypothetical protein
MPDEPKQEPLIDVPAAPRELSEAEALNALEVAMQKVSRRLAPVPLRDPDGMIRAYACPRCLRVNMSTSCGGPNARAEEAKHSRERALRCGICDTCGNVMDCLNSRLCDPCRKAENEALTRLQAARLLEEAAKPSEPEPTFQEHYDIVQALADDDDLTAREQAAIRAVLAELTA